MSAFNLNSSSTTDELYGDDISSVRTHLTTHDIDKQGHTEEIVDKSHTPHESSEDKVVSASLSVPSTSKLSKISAVVADKDDSGEWSDDAPSEDTVPESSKTLASEGSPDTTNNTSDKVSTSSLNPEEQSHVSGDSNKPDVHEAKATGKADTDLPKNEYGPVTTHPAISQAVSNSAELSHMVCFKYWFVLHLS